MRVFPFVTVDVFTDQAFGGNPLALFTDARGLDEAAMLQLTREFNLSETVFVLPPADPSHHARIRIFCAAGEMPFAGHPLVGSGYVLADRWPDQDELLFEVPAGLVRVTIERDSSGKVRGAVIAAPLPLTVGPNFEPHHIAASASLMAGDLVTINHPPCVASVGNPFVIAEVTKEALSRARPDLAEFRRAGAETGLGDGFSLHLYAHDGDQLRARMFSPLSGLLEDPATGSANAPLAALLLSLGDEDFARFTVIQGVEMGRPSLLALTATRRDRAIWATVGGQCVPIFEGRFRI